jgi:hypothetical protein
MPPLKRVLTENVIQYSIPVKFSRKEFFASIKYAVYILMINGSILSKTGASVFVACMHGVHSGKSSHPVRQRLDFFNKRTRIFSPIS